MKTYALSLMAAAVLLTLSQPARASDFDKSMEGILSDYLKIHQALAADKTEGVAQAATSIATAAKKLNVKQADAAQQAAYKGLPDGLAKHGQAVASASDIKGARSAFKDLSKTLETWFAVAQPKGTVVMTCPMAAANWLQTGDKVLNPYYGSDMLHCGHKVKLAGK